MEPYGDDMDLYHCINSSSIMFGEFTGICCEDECKDGKYLEQENDFDKYDHCYECSGYGDDYYEDEEGNLVCACEHCFFDPGKDDDEII